MVFICVCTIIDIVCSLYMLCNHFVHERTENIALFMIFNHIWWCIDAIQCKHIVGASFNVMLYDSRDVPFFIHVSNFSNVF